VEEPVHCDGGVGGVGCAARWYRSNSGKCDGHGSHSPEMQPFCFQQLDPLEDRPSIVNEIQVHAGSASQCASQSSRVYIPAAPPPVAGSISIAP
jgi:hypothetical protein